MQSSSDSFGYGIKHPALYKKTSGSLRYSDSSEKPIAVVNLEMGTTSEQITVYRGDDVRILAEMFCGKHNLNDDCVDYIVQNINQQLEPRQHPPSFGVKQQQQEHSLSNMTTQANQSIEDLKKTRETEAAQKYENWQKIIGEKQSNERKNQPQKIVSPPTKHFYTKNSDGSSCFNRLYEEGVEQQRLREEISDFYHEQKGQSELEQATFQPLISPRSKQLAINARKNTTHDIGSFLYETGQQMESKKQRDIKIHKDEINKFYTFKPEINTKSKRLTNNRSITPVHSKLYTDGFQMQEAKDKWAKDQFDKKHPFKPKSKSPHSKQLSYKEQQDIVRRLMLEQEAKQKRVQIKKQQDNTLVDKQTGQKYFQPKIDKQNKIYEQVSRKRNYEDILIAKAIQDQSLRKSGFKAPQLQPSRSQQQLQTNKSSSKILEVRNDEEEGNKDICHIFSVIQGIFELLDSDQDGIITAEQIDLQRINGDVLEIIAEVLFQMEDHNLSLDRLSFKQLCFEYQIQSDLVKVHFFNFSINNFEAAPQKNKMMN